MSACGVFHSSVVTEANNLYLGYKDRCLDIQAWFLMPSCAMFLVLLSEFKCFCDVVIS